MRSLIRTRKLVLNLPTKEGSLGEKQSLQEKNQGKHLLLSVKWDSENFDYGELRVILPHFIE